MLPTGNTHDFTYGVVNTATFGLPEALLLRQGFQVDKIVNRQTKAYNAGVATGMILGMLAGAGEGEAAAEVAEAIESAEGQATVLTKFYPENNGFSGATEQTFLMPGQTINRYGGSGYSRFFSPQGTPPWARSLPPGTAGQSLRTFEVVKPFEVQSGTVAPWFNQPGGGLQFRTPVNLDTLLKHGIIR
jgi:hypothetical protein